ncbi:MAG: response regulator [Desulfuromonadaceae bacterium]
MPDQLSHTRNSSSRALLATVLVVDDEPVIREMCQRVLKNYRVLQAGTCEDALLIFETEQVDLILTDIQMPGRSGIDLLKQVKSLDPTAVVIIMTGFSDKEIILNALKEDADDFINKPLNFLQMETAIEKALERKTLKEELTDIRHSDDLKNVFLSLISHKLRTPITGISLLLQNLTSGMFNPEDPIFQDSISMAIEETRYLDQLIADLLAFSQVMSSSSNVSKSPNDLNEIVADVLMQCREEHGNFDVELETAPRALPPVMLDASKIRFVLYQVIDNAFKFSGELGHVSIRIGSHADSVFIVVSDSGIGIPESEIAKVFEKFYQIDPDNTGQIRGFGLGLFYARDFVRQHGGSISLTSEAGLGTTVTISLPLN